MRHVRYLAVTLAASCALALMATPSIAQKRYGPGATDSEIRIGQTMPYSGPASAYGVIGKAEAAYFRKVNDEGGINGRQIRFISLDDSYSPPKTVEMTRRLVEQDEVLLLFGSLGTATNGAVAKYLNDRGIPQLFIATGASKFSDPRSYPWTLPGVATYSVEAQVYAKHILATKPDAKIAVLFQNDDFGKDYLSGFKEGLGSRSGQVVAQASYEVTDPTVDSQIVALKGSGAEVLLNASTPKFAAQAIRKMHDIGWKPLHYAVGPAAGIKSVLVPAGVDLSIGVITASASKDPIDPHWNDDAGMKDYRAFMKKYYPDGDPNDINNSAGYSIAMLLAQVLRACGDDLTRENVMRQATTLKEVRLPLSLPGVVGSTAPDDYRWVKMLQMRRFDGQRFVSISDLIRIGGQP